MSETQKLAEGFQTPSLDDWIALAEKALGGRDPFEALSQKTYDGLTRRPLYTSDDAPTGGAGAGFPGIADFRRGRTVATGGAWLVCQAYDDAAPEQVKRAILRDLDRGVDAVELVIDRPDRTGLKLSDLDDLDRALDGVCLEAAGLSLDSGDKFVETAALVLALVDRRGNDPDQCRIALNADPLGAAARAGGLPFPLDEGLAHLGRLAAHSCKHRPKVTTAAVSSSVYHDGGASNVQELAASLSTMVAYLRAMEPAGLDPAEAASEMVFRISLDADVFAGIAKLRALRRLAARVLKACGVDGVVPPPVHAVTSARMMSTVDPWVNMLRTTVAALTAAIAGADRMTVRPFDCALGPADSFSRRIARNVQTILAEESALARVIDPAGGSFAIECMTDELAQEAWAAFQRLEDQGGIDAMLKSGALAEQIDAVWQRRRTDIAHRRPPLTGVSAFPKLDEKRPEKISRENNELEDHIESESQDMPNIDGADIPALVAAASEGAGMAEIAAVIAGTAEQFAPIKGHRLGEAFEILRAASDAYHEESGERPRIFLANLGRLAEHTARATFAQNLFAAGGIEAVIGSGGTDVDTIVAEWRDSGAKDAVICGSDDLYADHLVTVAQGLKKAGVRHIILADKPGDHEKAYRGAGVDEFIYTGCDVLAALTAAHERMALAGGGS